ncbi:MAG: FG-GAP-like repeat-containing protein [Candidatus Eiseniibacteriota bacterium]
MALALGISLVAPCDSDGAVVSIDEPGLDIESGIRIQVLAEGDFDADGLLDLASVESAGSDGGDLAVRVRFGLGRGRFGPASHVTDVAVGTRIAVARMDGDALDDLVVGGPSCNACASGALQVWVGAVDRSFAPAHPAIPIERRPTAMAVGDIDGDHDLDVAAAFEDAGSGHDYSIFFNDGSASLIQKPGRIGYTSEDLAIADVTGDGVADLVSLFYLWISIRPGTGGGTFHDPGFAIGTPSRLGTLTVARVDADWDLDIVGGTSLEPGLVVFRNDGGGDFTRLPAIPTSERAGRVIVSDLNGDLTPDLVAPIRMRNEVAIFHGNEADTFAPAYIRSTGYRPNQTVVGDVNQDGLPDVVTGSESELALVVHLGQGDGFVGSSGLVTGEAPSAITVGDFDVDGRREFAIANRNAHTVSVFRAGAGEGSWIRSDLTVGVFPIGVGFADLDQDGKNELITIHASTGQLEVRRGLGAGDFEPPVGYAVCEQPRVLRFSDFDRDGRIDVIVGCDASSTALTILYGLGNAVLGNRADYAPSGSPYGMRDLQASDVTGDGRVDAIVATERGAQIALYPGAANGGLGTPVSLFAGGWVTGVDYCDVDGDGRLDLVAARPDGDEVVVFRGLGLGSFGDPVGIPAGFAPQAVRAGDVDGDRVADLIVSGAGRTTPQSAGSVRVLRGLGGGMFEPAASILVGKAPGELAFGDVTDDGRADILVAGPSLGTVDVLINHSEIGSVGVGPSSMSGDLSCRVHPNPSTGTIRLAVASQRAGPARIDLYSVTGRRVLSRAVELPRDAVIALEPGAGLHLAPGLYVVRMEQAGRQVTTRAILLP